uniref:E3 ubiquitin-protein ligase rnf4-like protein isoform x1 n=1 Tax=Triatoma infestans TaxID=30076 RepID=A0A171ACJ7_TRIIF
MVKALPRIEKENMKPVVKKITIKRAKVSREIERDPSPLPKKPCPICFEDLANPDIKVEATPCAHVFCSDCLVRALNVKSVCPVCREPLEDILHDFYDDFAEDNDSAAYVNDNAF